MVKCRNCARTFASAQGERAHQSVHKLNHVPPRAVVLVGLVERLGVELAEITSPLHGAELRKFQGVWTTFHEIDEHVRTTARVPR